METKNYFATDGNGRYMPGALVYIYYSGTVNLAAGIRDISNNPLENPFTSQGNGLIQFKAPNGTYDVRVVKGARDYTLRDQQCADLADLLNQTDGMLGAHASAPTTRNDGTPLQISDTYFNTTNNYEYIFNGTEWQINNVNGADIANETDPNKGARLVGYDNATAADIIGKVRSMQGYTALRQYRGVATAVLLTKINIKGFFDLDVNDTNSPDDGYKTIIDAKDRRWKRRYVGAVQLTWFQEEPTDNWSAAWRLAIAANNIGGTKGLFLQLPPYVTKIDEEMPELTAPMAQVGFGTDKSIVFFAGVNGFTYNLSTYTTGGNKSSGFCCIKLDDLSYTTNVLSKTGLKLLGPATPGPGIFARIGSVQFAPHSRAIGNEDSSEWLVNIQIGSPNGPKTAEVHLGDVTITGSLSNTLYATRTQSIGVLGYNVTGLRWAKPKITLVQDAIVLDGQCEGAIIGEGTIICGRGIVFRNPVSPANNHDISGTHISAYTRGIAFEMPAGGAPLPLANFGTDIFILERESGTTKEEDFVGAEMYTKYSGMKGLVVWANSTGGSHNRIGVRASNHNNKIEATFKNMDYPFDIVPYAADADAGAVDARGCIISGSNLKAIDKSANPFLIYSDLKDPTVGAAALIQRAASWRIRHNAADKNLFRINSSSVVFGEHLTASLNLDFSTTPTGTSGYDVRLLMTGGDAGGGTSGKGDMVVTAASMRFNGSALRPETSGLPTLGNPQYLWNSVYSQNSALQTSDARCKQSIGAINDKTLDAVADIQYRQFKMNDEVKKNGDSAKWSHGVIAQEVIEVFKKYGLDAKALGLVEHNHWSEKKAEYREWDNQYDDDGNFVKAAGRELISEAQPAGDRYSVNYTELAVLEAALHRRTNARLLLQLKVLGIK